MNTSSSKSNTINNSISNICVNNVDGSGNISWMKNSNNSSNISKIKQSSINMTNNNNNNNSNSNNIGHVSS